MAGKVRGSRKPHHESQYRPYHDGKVKALSRFGFAAKFTRPGCQRAVSGFLSLLKFVNRSANVRQKPGLWRAESQYWPSRLPA
jgi:hypothetical protein